MKIKIKIKKPSYISPDLHQQIVNKMAKLNVGYWSAFAFCKCELLKGDR